MTHPARKFDDGPPSGRPLPGPLRLNVTSDPANLAPVRKAVEQFAGECGFDATSAGEVGLCVNEALANVTRHAYGGKTDQPVVVTASYQDNELLVSVRDWGSGERPPNVPRHDPLTPGGLGLVCLKTLMDGIAYEPQPDGMLLKMKKAGPR